MNTRVIIAIIIVIFLFLCFAGCTDNEDDGAGGDFSKFFGRWSSGELGGNYTFYSNGTFTFIDPDEEFAGTYEVNNGNISYTYTYPPDMEGDVESFTYSFLNNDTAFSISPIGYPQFEIIFVKQ